MWGTSQDQPPLEIAVKDDLNNSCLSIAILRGHLRTAEAIIPILQAQHKKKEPQSQVRFEMDIDEDESDAEPSDGEEINITSHIVDDQFTHENVGEIVTQVESQVTPLRALQDSCGAYNFLGDQSELLFREFGSDRMYCFNLKLDTLLSYAIFKNDMSLFEFIIKLGKQCAKMDPSGKTEFTIAQRDFQLAIAMGRMDCLVRMIQTSAAGLPLAKMCEQSGVKPKEEHRYYPGLSIRGKKRKDWADAGRVVQLPPPGSRPPLLIAATQGNLSATEWFLGTAPGRYYVEYANSRVGDENIKSLSQSKLGLEGSILKWLQTRSEYISQFTF